MDTSTKIIYDYLKSKYNKILLNKKELAKEMGISPKTLDSYISKNIGTPKYKKLGNKPNSRVVFNILDVAEFISNDYIETM